MAYSNTDLTITIERLLIFTIIRAILIRNPREVLQGVPRKCLSTFPNKSSMSCQVSDKTKVSHPELGSYSCIKLWNFQVFNYEASEKKSMKAYNSTLVCTDPNAVSNKIVLDFTNALKSFAVLKGIRYKKSNLICHLQKIHN